MFSNGIIRIGFIYGSIYILLFILILLVEIVVFIPRLLGASFMYHDALLYYFGIIPVRFAGLILPWLREGTADFSSSYVTMGHVGFSLLGILITVVAFIVVFLIIDLCIMLLWNPGVKRRNRPIIEKNKLVMIENDKIYKAWDKSEDCARYLARISELENQVAQCDRYICTTTIVHNEFKVENTLKWLVYYIETGRARNLTEAINKMDDDIIKNRMLEIEEERLWVQQCEAEAAERAAEYAWQSNHNSELAIEEAERASKEAERASKLASSAAFVSIINTLYDD